MNAMLHCRRYVISEIWSQVNQIGCSCGCPHYRGPATLVLSLPEFLLLVSTGSPPFCNWVPWKNEEEDSISRQQCNSYFSGQWKMEEARKWIPFDEAYKLRRESLTTNLPLSRPSHFISCTCLLFLAGITNDVANPLSAHSINDGLLKHKGESLKLQMMVLDQFV